MTTTQTSPSRELWRELAFWTALVILVAGFAAWQWAPAKDVKWTFDEGLNAIKATMIGDGHALYRDVWSDQPPLLAEMLALVYRVFGPSLLVGRALALSMAALGLAGVALLGRTLAGRLAGILAAALLAILPGYQELGRAILVGGPAVHIAAWGLLAAVAYARSGSRMLLGLTGVALGVSLLIKPIAAPYYLALVGAVMLREHADRRSLVLDMVTLHGALGLTILAGVAPYSLRIMASQIIGTLLKARALPTEAETGSLLSMLAAHNVSFGLASLSLLGVAGVVGLWREGRLRDTGPVLLALVGSLVALAVQRPLRSHHLLLIMPPLAALAGAGFALGAERITELARRPLARNALVGGTASVLILSLALAGLIPSAQAAVASRAHRMVPRGYNNWVRRAPEAVQRLTAPDDILITDDPMIAILAERPTLPELAVPSEKRIDTGQLTGERLVDLTERHQPAAVVMTKRLWRMDGYAAWLRGHYAASICDGPEQLVLVPFAPNAPVHAATDLGLTLRGALVPGAGEPGDEMPLRLYIHAEQPVPEGIHAYVQLIDDSGAKWSEVDLDLYIRDLELACLPDGFFAALDCFLPVDPKAPPGPMTLWVGMLREGASGRLALSDADGAPIPDNQVALGFGPVVRWEPRYEIGDVSQRCDAALGGALALQGYSLPDGGVKPGETFALTLAWRCLAPTDADLSVFAHVVDGDGQLVAQADGPPDAGRKPTYAWLADEVILDERAIILPEDPSVDTLRVLVGVYDPATGARLLDADGADHVALGELAVAR